MSNRSQKTGPRDVFLHLLSIITLYFSAASLGILLYQIINIYFPDPLSQNRFFDPQSYYSPLRFAVASLTIVFPVYIWSNWYLGKEYTKTPAKLQLKTRRWLLSFTVFAASLFIIGDLVAVINRYLEGDLTTRFGLKVLTILAISASIFYYYLNQLKNKPAENKTKLLWFNKLILLLVIIAIGSGFWIAGSPQNQRLARFDEQKITDLQDIQWQIVTYWQKKETLPENLNQLTDDISGYIAPNDPQTGQQYEYQVIGDLQFQLCANFNSSAEDYNTVSAPKPIKPSLETQSWSHAAGRACFTRAIDPELYKTNSNQKLPLLPAQR